MLEQRLVAPCCWVQTLDVHDSPVAQELRAEIHRRLLAGEPASKIEADMVARYGERIRAMPPGNPLAKVAAAVSGAVALAALLLVLMVRRWVKRDRAAQAEGGATATGRATATGGAAAGSGAAAARGAGAAGKDAPPRDEYDDRLDEQLRKMD
jgi:cytochrome c-type biogenesis protein CcmH